LKWINDTLVLNVQRIEQTAAGHIACQIIDICFPNTVSMSKVKWSATQEYE